jgi:hypothetical protein
MVPKRAERIKMIKERDGDLCFICKKPFINNLDITIEHWIPRAAGGSDELDNLRISHKKCNVAKADLIPNPDGTLPEKPKKIPYNKRQTEKKRILGDFCYDCQGGRNLQAGQSCEFCGALPGPIENPRYLKRKSPECDHNIFWCWACSIGIVEKKSVTQHLITG